MKIYKLKVGVSLIVLVITIIVMVILAGAIILALNNSGIIEKANVGKAKSDLSTLMEEISVKSAERKLNGLDIDGRYKLSEWGIENSKYEDRVIIAKGKLKVLNEGKNDEIEKAAKELDIIANSSNAILENTTGEALLNYKIYGNTVQGENILDKNNVDYIIGYFIRSKPTIVTHDNARTIYVKCKPNTAYTVRRSISFSQFHIGFTSEIPEVGMQVKNVASADSSQKMQLSVQTDETAKYLVIYCYNGYSKTDDFDEIVNSLYVAECPTLDKAVPIKSLGDLVTDTNDVNYGKYKIEVNVSSKNLLHSDVKTRTLNGVTLVNNNGEITLNGTCTESANFDMAYIDFEPGTYTLSANANEIPVKNGYSLVQIYDATNKQNIYLSNQNALGYITGKINKKAKFLYRIRIDKGTTYNNLVLKPQLEVGKEKTTFVTYQNGITTNIYLNEPLRKIDEYADYIDFNAKKVVRNVRSELSYKREWKYEEDKDIIYYGVKNAKINYYTLCNYFINEPGKLGNNPYILTVDEVVRIYNRGYFKNIDVFKDWIKNKEDFEVVYPLLEKVEENVELPEILTVKGDTIISAGSANGVEASNVIAEY